MAVAGYQVYSLGSELFATMAAAKAAAGTATLATTASTAATSAAATAKAATATSALGSAASAVMTAAPFLAAAYSAITLIKGIRKRKKQKNEPDAFAVAVMQGLSLILNSVLNMHTEMRHLFEIDFALHQKTLEVVTQCAQQIFNEIHDVCLPAIESVRANTNQWGNTLLYGQEVLALEPCRDLIRDMNDRLTGTTISNAEVEIEKIAARAAAWLKKEGETALPIHNGISKRPIDTHDESDQNKWLNEVLLSNLSAEALSEKTGFFAYYAHSVLGVKLCEEEVTQAIFNPRLWSQLAEVYTIRH
jgi:hypothetical protein